MQSFFRPLLVVSLVLLVPVVPFVLFGAELEAQIEAWLTPPPAPSVLAAAVAGVLATDVFLPVPSSAVSTLGGAKLGIWAGTATSWLGLSVGAVLGFGLARAFGHPLAERLAGADELARMEKLSERFGPLVLVLARAVPVLAEASVLLLGATRLGWRRFLPPTLAANFGIALAYSAFGQWAEQYELLPLALAISLALPVLVATMARHWRPAPSHNP